NVLWIGEATNLSYLQQDGPNQKISSIVERTFNVFDLASDGATGGFAATQMGLFHLKVAPPSAERQAVVGTTYAAYRGIGGTWAAIPGEHSGEWLKRWADTNSPGPLSDPENPPDLLPEWRIGRVNRFAEARDSLWIAANNGLFHWRPGWDKPRAT